MSLAIFLIGVSYSASPPDKQNTGPQPRRPIVQNSPQQRIQVVRQLKEQVQQWQRQASQIKPHEIPQTLKEVPQIGTLDIMVGDNWDQVTILLVSQMRNLQASRWEKVYVGQRLISLLNRAPKEDLARQAKLLGPAFLSAPDPIRDLPEPSVEFPVPEQTEATESGTEKAKEPLASEAYLHTLQQAKDDAKKRNAQDKQIVLINQSVEVLGRNFASLLLENSDNHTYLAVINKLHRQLRNTDAGFVGTIEALDAARLERLDRLDLTLARTTANRLKRLIRAFAGPRQYSVYTEVKIKQDKRSEFGQIELDFKVLIENTLSKLTERIERGPRPESSEPTKKTPELLERTPGPKE